MAKRDHDTEIWLEDWFLNLSDAEMLFWFYIKDKCDHAGFWRPNFKMFENCTGRRINQEEFLKKINTDKKRIEILGNGKWFLCGFIAFQFRGRLNTNNSFHRYVMETVRKNVNIENTMDYGFEVKETSRRPLGDLSETSTGTRNREQGEEKEGVGEKETNPIYRQCSDLLKKRILEKRQQKITEKTLLEWDRQVRLMVDSKELPRKIEDILTLINECHDMQPSPSGFSWANNILSMGKFREKWDEGKIFIGMNKIIKLYHQETADERSIRIQKKIDAEMAAEREKNGQ